MVRATPLSDSVHLPEQVRHVKQSAALFFGLAALGCTTLQPVPIECVTESMQIYVDKRLIEGNPDLLQLATDEPHVVFVRAEGYEPQRFILEPELGADGETRLSPASLCLELVPVGQGRELQIEVDDDPL